MATEKILKRTYQDLIGRKIHKSSCYCASCLYHFFKLKNKKSRIDKDNFFLYWLTVYTSEIKKNANSKSLSGNKEHYHFSLFNFNKDRDHNWSRALQLYYKITEQEWRKDQLEERERFRIVSRYDKKFNISQLNHERDEQAYFLPMNISGFLLEINRFLKSRNKYSKINYSPPVHLLPIRSLKTIFKKIRLAIKIVFYLEDLGENETIKHREILRHFHINQLELLVLLDYLEQKNIIAWNKKEKIASLHSDWKNAFEFFINWFLLIDKSLGDLAPFSIDAAVYAFEQNASSILTK